MEQEGVRCLPSWIQEGVCKCSCKDSHYKLISTASMNIGEEGNIEEMFYPASMSWINYVFWKCLLEASLSWFGSFKGFWALVSCSDWLNQHFLFFFFCNRFILSNALSLPPSWALWVTWIYFMGMLNRIWCCSYLLQHGKWRQMINCIKGDVYHHRVRLSQKDLRERNLGQSSQVHLEDFPKGWNTVYVFN